MVEDAVEEKNREELWDKIKLLVMVLILAILVIIVLTMSRDKDNVEQELDTAEDTVVNLVDLVDQFETACDRGESVPIFLRAVCSRATTVAQNPEIVRGDQGDRGPVGAPGIPGLEGPRGPAPTATQIAKAVAAYLRNNPPAAGQQGETGTPGTAGSQGQDGAPGQDGTNGKDGARGEPGPACPEGFVPNNMTVLTPDGPQEAVICTSPEPSPN